MGVGEVRAEELWNVTGKIIIEYSWTEWKTIEIVIGHYGNLAVKVGVKQGY